VTLERLLARVRTRRLDARWLMARARRRRRREGASLDSCLAETYERVRAAVERRLAAEGAVRAPGPVAGFLCDASLGGLARWLRAAGYPAAAAPGGQPGDLVAEAARLELVLATSDHRLLERRAVRAGTPVAVWVPSRLGRLEQLGMVLRELRLPAREPLCMSCGGELRPVAKESVRERIPPRTALWRDEYFLCAACGRLFWHGTHWDRIRRRLEAVTPGARRT